MSVCVYKYARPNNSCDALGGQLSYLALCDSQNKSNADRNSNPEVVGEFIRVLLLRVISCFMRRWHNNNSVNIPRYKSLRNFWRHSLIIILSFSISPFVHWAHVSHFHLLIENYKLKFVSRIHSSCRNVASIWESVPILYNLKSSTSLWMWALLSLCPAIKDPGRTVSSLRIRSLFS